VALEPHRIAVLWISPPPTSTLFPYTTLFRSGSVMASCSFHAGNSYAPTVTLSVWETGHSTSANTSNVSYELSISRPSNVSSSTRSEEHTSELQSRFDLVCRLLLEKKKRNHLT